MIKKILKNLQFQTTLAEQAMYSYQRKQVTLAEQAIYSYQRKQVTLAEQAIYSYQRKQVTLAEQAIYIVGQGGLEPPTSRLSGVHSNQLSY
jgi:hypothetical protein